MYLARPNDDRARWSSTLTDHIEDQRLESRVGSRRQRQRRNVCPSAITPARNSNPGWRIGQSESNRAVKTVAAHGYTDCRFAPFRYAHLPAIKRDRETGLHWNEPLPGTHARPTATKQRRIVWRRRVGPSTIYSRLSPPRLPFGHGELDGGIAGDVSGYAVSSGEQRRRQALPARCHGLGYFKLVAFGEAAPSAWGRGLNRG